jgi:hypothetical protein
MTKITIVIGAGASADFRIKLKSSNDLEEKIRMPTGEELSKLIADKNEIVEFFCFKYLKEATKDFFHHPAFFSDSTTEAVNKTINAVCKYLTSSSDHELTKSHNERFLPNMSYTIAEQNGGSDCDIDTTKAIQIIYDLFTKTINQNISEEYDCYPAARTRDVREHLYSTIRNSDEFKIYFELSELVGYYRPFSIDELLDSIRNGKVDVQPNVSDKKISDFKELKEYRENLVTAGKQLIALFLLQAEDEKVFTNNEAVCWYRHLRNLIITSGKNSDEIKKNLESLTIISFNYDRSLDYFLCKKVGREFYDKIKSKIIYPYGKIAQDNFDWEEFRDYKDIPYGYYKRIAETATAKDKHDFFEKAKILGGGLRVIGELSSYKNEDLLRGDNESSEAYQSRLSDLHQKLTNNEDQKIIVDLLRISTAMNGKHEKNKFYFLGFGFHEENCRIINLEGIKLRRTASSTHLIHYTNYANSKKIEEILNNSLSASRSNNDLFRNYQFKFSSEKGVYEALLYDLDLSFL